jgi:hypothetical protein
MDVCARQTLPTPPTFKYKKKIVILGLKNKKIEHVLPVPSTIIIQSALGRELNPPPRAHMDDRMIPPSSAVAPISPSAPGTTSP